jgi:tetratricopeptide (TPR) repeat protein
MLEEILQLHKSGQLEEAETRYRELLMFNPDDVEVLHLLGMVRRQRGDFREGMELVARAIELAPDRANFQMSLAGMQFHARQFDAAKISFEAAIKLNPNLTGAYSALGQIAMLNGDSTTAESHFKIALKAGEDDPQVLTSLGNLHMGRGDKDLAIKYLSRAAELRQDDPATQASLGRALLANGMIAFGEQALNTALQNKPDFHIARLLLAESALKQNQYPQAQERFAELIAAGEHLGPAHAGIGDIARANGNLTRAAQHYAQSLAARPDQSQVVAARAGCLLRLGQLDNAQSVLRDALRRKPDDHLLLSELSALLLSRGLFAEALRLWQERVALAPEDALAQAQLATLLEVSRDYPAAVQSAQAALRAGPGAVEPNLILARAALRDRDGVTAIERLEKMNPSALSPQQARQRWHLLGMAHDLREQPQAAVAAWREAHAAIAQTSRLQALDAVPVSLLAQIPSPSAASNADLMPIFLIGAPGSGVDRVAALLGDQAGISVLSDRFTDSPRNDGIAAPDFDLYLSASMPAEAERFARRYRRALERQTVRAGAQVIDWLPHWDARLLPALAQALPKARLLIVQRDSRDVFLNWLAFGWAPGYALPDLALAAQWLSRVIEHQSACATLPVLSQHVLSADQLHKDEQDTCIQLAKFLGVDRIVPGSGYARVQVGLGQLPVALPAERWQAYRDALAPAFRVLQRGA